ncbi:endonuclease III [bacterium]|jgi:endonuclease III|nr:endonuclease III [bacterium]
MARESTRARKVRLEEIHNRLYGEFPDPQCALLHKNPFELLIATILSAQCTDKKVNDVTPFLFERYECAADFAAASLEDLEFAIRSIGLFRSKAKNIRQCCQLLLERHQGEVPQTMEELISLPGVGRKTANVVLGNAFGKNEGIVVDTHVNRISNLLGLTSSKTPEKIERDLIKIVPRTEWTNISHLLILHGRKTCIARRPRCSQCPLTQLCPAGQDRTVLA